MDNAKCIAYFEEYLTEEKKASANTLSSYLRDIRQLGAYLDEHAEHGIQDADENDLGAYIAWMKTNGKSVATVSRSIASIKSLYQLLTLRQVIPENPSTKLVSDKNTQKKKNIFNLTGQCLEK